MEALKILVVDDEARMRKLVRDFLTIKGFRVVEAENGEQAVDIFFDNIFADWIVRDQIRRSQEEMYGLQGRIGAIQNRLREETAQTQQNLHSARDRLDRLVEEA